jgi:hypothetical protein
MYYYIGCKEVCKSMEKVFHAKIIYFWSFSYCYFLPAITVHGLTLGEMKSRANPRKRKFSAT